MTTRPVHVLITTALTLTIGLSLPACATTPTARDPAVTTTDPAAVDLRSKAPLAADRVTLHVNGLSCPLCASNVDKQLAAIPGVTDVQVDFDKGTIAMSLNEPRPSPFALTHAIDRAGFTLVRISPE